MADNNREGAMLDFTELRGNGRGLEQLMRELLVVLGFHPQWSGVGPDGGRDLLFDEFGSDILGRKPRRWLVSCKDYAASGKAVGADDVSGLVETCQQHNADGFLLVCTTHPSSSTVTRLHEVEQNARFSLLTHVWDGVMLERLLASPRGWTVAQRAMPASTAITGWKIFGTRDPHRWVAAHRGYYFHLSNRVGSGGVFDLGTLDRRLDEIEITSLPAAHQLRPRGIWFDDAKGGGYVWYLDYLLPYGEPEPDIGAILDRLDNGNAWTDGQFHSFEIELRSVQRGSDHFDPDHYSYYARLPSYL